ncbi:uncharacterized protein LOC108915665 [Anoplophora glabripennis]|uniref:uncharacterized protein LOC108915665 n=1 Tax=Anoplophora glabripennis TaxID=217634 RepID=UPI00087426A8|nr:uncharacterized protein LOC108915665 [Anoplophora glabripennis]
MAIVARYGKPDLFITFTCNPRWPEIRDNLEGRQKWEHRPDLVCRVFKRKLDAFIDDIVHKQIYGIVLSYMYVIEFQKRGLPHAHITVTFMPDDKLLTVEDVDAVISAVIPDRQVQPEMYALVAANHLHCSGRPHDETAPCMTDDREGRRSCSKFFPKPNRDVTVLNLRKASGFAEYR